MNITYHKWWSHHLNQDMELKVYGHAGKPVLVFPTQGGRFFEFEDFGMVAECLPWIERGMVTLYTVDSLDQQSWANWDAHPADRARRHEDYDRYIIKEVLPFLREYSQTGGKAFTAGCSMGAYHCANFFFRHPDCFDGTIAMSGPLRLNLFIGDYMDETVYYNTPLAYLPGLNDPWYLDQYRNSEIVVCVGQGAWEEPMLEDARALKAILEKANIPAWIDFWGQDVSHDWPWWRKMMPYFLEQLLM